MRKFYDEWNTKVLNKDRISNNVTQNHSGIWGKGKNQRYLMQNFIKLFTLASTLVLALREGSAVKLDWVLGGREWRCGSWWKVGWSQSAESPECWLQISFLNFLHPSWPLWNICSPSLSLWVCLNRDQCPHAPRLLGSRKGSSRLWPRQWTTFLVVPPATHLCVICCPSSLLDCKLPQGGDRWIHPVCLAWDNSVVMPPEQMNK